MVMLERSICHHFRPWTEDVGKAWWLLCQDSPNDGSASHARLRDSSLVSKSRRPKTWHSELIEYVTWCSTPTRISPPQSSDVRPVTSGPPSRKPIPNGTMKPATTQKTNVLLTHATTGSLSRSGA